MQPGHSGSNFSFDTPLRAVGWERLGGFASGTLPPLARYVPAWPPLAAGAGSLGASFPKQASFLPLIYLCTGGCRSLTCVYWWLQELSRARESWSPATVPSPARLYPTQPCPKERVSREHEQTPSAALRSTGALVALLSRAAASRRGAGDGQQSQVWRAQSRDAVPGWWGRQGISAEAALIWELQKRMPGASSSCSSWLRAAL